MAATIIVPNRTRIVQIQGVYLGETWAKAFDIETEDGAPVPLLGLQMRMLVQTDPAAANDDAVAECALAVGDDPSNRLAISLEADQSAALTAGVRHYADLSITDAADKPWAMIRFIFTPEHWGTKPEAP